MRSEPVESCLLQCNGVSKSFAGTRAVHDLHITLRPNEIVGLIGPNGSGKSTLINIISGFYTPDEGLITFDGSDLADATPQQRRTRGISRTFQNARLYKELSVLDNMMIGLHLQLAGRRLPLRVLSALVGTPAYRRAEKLTRTRALADLDRFGLADVRNLSVHDLPYGLERKLELARALALEPKLVLLDEPTAGLSSAEAHEMRVIVEEMVERSGVAVLLVEHRLEWVVDISDRVVVIDAGSQIADGPPQEVVSNPAVIAAYIGA